MSGRINVWRVLLTTATAFAVAVPRPVPAREPHARVHGLIALSMAPVSGYVPDIYVMRPDGSGLINLTQHPSADMSPSWSPDGSRIAFMSDRDGSPRRNDIFVMDADGGNVRNLTNTPDLDERSPDWSPDGTSLVFRVTLESDPTIVTMKVEGSRLRPFALGGNPAWSPDGEWIAYDTAMGASEDSVLLIRPEGRGHRVLRDDSSDDEEPAWSPDSRRLAYIHDEALAIVRADGSKQRIFFFNMGTHTSPSWSASGREVVFVRGSVAYVLDIRSGIDRELETPLGYTVVDADWGPV
jgi:TolB protein